MMTGPETRDPGLDTRLERLLVEGLQTPLFSGAVAAIQTPRGRGVAYVGTHAVDDAQAVGPRSRFDLASISKLVTAAVVLRLSDSGTIALDLPVSGVLRLGGGGRAQAITPRMLLRHTSGLPAVSQLWKQQAMPGVNRLPKLLATPLASAPDETFLYSDLGYIAAGTFAERVSGTDLARLAASEITGPLGLESIGFGPIEPRLAVATEEQVGRGVVRGEVHDELSWWLGGVTGHAGLFGAGEDVLDLVIGLLKGRLLLPRSRMLIQTDDLKPGYGAPFGQALGPRVGDSAFMGDVVGVGQTGFTGTMWFALPEQGRFGVLLTNRVHLGRDTVGIMPFRCLFAKLVTEWATDLGI